MHGSSVVPSILVHVLSPRWMAVCRRGRQRRPSKSVIRWGQRRKASGCGAPAKQSGGPKSKRIEAHTDFILAEIATVPDVTIKIARLRGHWRTTTFMVGVTLRGPSAQMIIATSSVASW